MRSMIEQEGSPKGTPIAKGKKMAKTAECQTHGTFAPADAHGHAKCAAKVTFTEYPEYVALIVPIKITEPKA